MTGPPAEGAAEAQDDEPGHHGQDDDVDKLEAFHLGGPVSSQAAGKQDPEKRDPMWPPARRSVREAVIQK
jgi:hypothetical protein